MTTESYGVSEEFVRALPKTDLHVHIDGSLRPQTLLELARERKVRLPSETVSGLMETVFKDRYASLDDYLRGFSYTTAVLRDPEALERAGYELAEDNYNEGVRYFEARFAPQLHVSEHMDMTEVLRAVNRGLSRATKKFNRRPEVTSGLEPEYCYAITVCALRWFDEHTSPYYRDLLRVHPFTPRVNVFSLGSLELAQAAVAIRDQWGCP